MPARCPPLEVGSFRPLKQASGRQVENLMRAHTNPAGDTADKGRRRAYGDHKCPYCDKYFRRPVKHSEYGHHYNIQTFYCFCDAERALDKYIVKEGRHHYKGGRGLLLEEEEEPRVA